ncbi:hypothetical protein [Chryseobacterium mulctrae]|uniref:hypothetical protein n=1 Tax=Chryseobacterium mulctrae TaxID=2576777 RepID=UPI0011166654|nr:hypothetical protein [Chryseobacterium mulctrae]
MKLRSETTKIPLYGGLLTIVKCENWEHLKEVYKEALRKYSTQPNEKHDGYAFEAITENGTDQYIVAFKGTPKGSVIAHECVHLVNNLYANRAIELNLYDDEHQAYLLEWFFDQIDNFFNSNKIIWQ